VGSGKTKIGKANKREGLGMREGGIEAVNKKKRND
jgi:hypothetical protein